MIYHKITVDNRGWSPVAHRPLLAESEQSVTNPLMHIMNRTLIIITLSLAVTYSISSLAGTCLPKPVPVQVEKSKKDVVFKGKKYTLDVAKYTANIPTFRATWIEEGDPAYELVIFNKSSSSSCTIKNDQPFITFDDGEIYEANNGRVVITMEGIASWYQSSFYKVATCERIGHIEDLYPNNAYIKKFFDGTSTMRIGGGAQYELGDDCVPRKKR